MFKLNEDKNQIVLKGKNLFLFIAIGTMFMVIAGIKMIFALLPFEDGYSFSDVFGLIFLCIWTLVVFGMCLYSLINFSMRIIIDGEGILYKTWLSKRSLKWFEIKDWGLSYCGQTRGEGNTYYFYFSAKQQPIKKEHVKKLKGKAIKIVVFEKDYVELVNRIIPFCSLKTEVKPFICEVKNHLI